MVAKTKKRLFESDEGFDDDSKPVLTQTLPADVTTQAKATKNPKAKAKTKPKAAPKAQEKKKAPHATAFLLGCSKCRGSHVGCGKCRDPAFKGVRWQR